MTRITEENKLKGPQKEGGGRALFLEGPLENSKKKQKSIKKKNGGSASRKKWG